MFLRQSSTQTVVVGPVLDSTGAAVTTAVVTNFSLAKNGTAAAFTTETLTSLGNGYYSLALTTSNTNTLGIAAVFVNATTMSMTVFRWNVIAASVYDAIVNNATNASGGLLTATGAISALSGEILNTANLPTNFASLAITVGGATTVGAMAANTLTASALASDAVAEIADGVWDEAYSGHTTAGTFGKLMDILRKSNALIEGTVQASPTPTSTVFRTNVNYPTGAFEHAVLFFADDATIAEQNSPILTFVNNGGGLSTVTLEEATTSAPVAGDKFFIVPSSHVHSVADIQSGLALQTTSLAIKAKTDLITAGSVTYTSPVAASGKISIPIIIGDDYLAANTRAFEWEITSRAGYVVGTSSCKFGGVNEELGKSWSVTGTVSDIGGGKWKLSFDLSKTVTGALSEGYYRWSVELVSAGGTEVTEVYSGRNVEVRAKQT